MYTCKAPLTGLSRFPYGTPRRRCRMPLQGQDDPVTAPIFALVAMSPMGRLSASAALTPARAAPWRTERHFSAPARGGLATTVTRREAWMLC
jgi:hypothetical protein